MIRISSRQAREARNVVLLGVLFVLFFVLVFLSLGCKSTETIYEKVVVPQPYWDPPQDVEQPPDRPVLQAGDVTREEAEADPKAALRAVGRDLDAALGWGEHLHFLYLELMKRIAAEPTDYPPSGDGSDPPGG